MPFGRPPFVGGPFRGLQPSSRGNTQAPPASGLPTPLALWLLTEASSGNAPTTAVDSIASPVNLAITAGSNGSAWMSDAQGNGYQFKSVVTFGGTASLFDSGALNGTKIATALTGATQLTWLFKCSVDTLGGTVTTPLVTIGDSTGSDAVSAYEDAKTLWGNQRAANVIPLLDTDGAVHVYAYVFDTSQSTQANRLIVYQDGISLGAFGVGVSGLTLNQTVDSGQSWTNLHVYLGRNPSGDSVDATLKSVALYSTALTASIVAALSTAFAANDDVDPSGGTTATPAPVYVQEPNSSGFIAHRAGVSGEPIDELGNDDPHSEAEVWVRHQRRPRDFNPDGVPPPIAAAAVKVWGYEPGQFPPRSIPQTSRNIDSGFPILPPTVVEWGYEPASPIARPPAVMDTRARSGEPVSAKPPVASGFEPESPRTRSPAADRRSINGEPIAAKPSVAFGFEPAGPAPHSPRADVRGIGGEPLPSPIVAFVPWGFESPGPVTHSPRADIRGVSGEPTSSNPTYPQGFEPASPVTRSPQADRRPPVNGEPVVAKPSVAFGFEPPGPITRSPVADRRPVNGEPQASRPAYPHGFEPAAPVTKTPLADRRLIQGEPWPFVPIAAWGYEPASPWTKSPRADMRAIAFGDPLPFTPILRWGYEPASPMTRSPQADRRQWPGEPLPIVIAFALTAWGYEPAYPTTRSPTADRRMWQGEPLPRNIIAAWGWEPAGPTPRSPRGDMRWTSGEPIARSPIAAPWGWEPYGPTTRSPRADWRWTSGEPFPTSPIAAPSGWDLASAPTSRAVIVDRRLVQGDPIAVARSIAAGFDAWTAPARPWRPPAQFGGDPTVPVVMKPWGWEPESPRARRTPFSFGAASADPSPKIAVPPPWGYEPADPRVIHRSTSLVVVYGIAELWPFVTIFHPTNTLAASSIIDQFVSNVLLARSATTLHGRFREAAYRRQLELDPEAGTDGMFHVEILSGTQGRPFFGDGKNIRDLVVNVRVAYWRSADRRLANRNAMDDMVRISDLCENPLNYNSLNTGIRDVHMTSLGRVINKPKSEIWEARFAVEWQQGGFG